MSGQSKDTGIVNIHGKEYKTVAKRVDEFRKEHKTNYAIITELVSRDEDSVVMVAKIIDKEGDRTVATGYAEEKRSASQINKTSALENCETSAIGRALANFGLGGGEYASADEVANAIYQQGATSQPTKSYNINFDEIRENLQMMDDVESVNEYAKEVKAKLKNPTEKMCYIIKTIFDDRRKELEG